MAVAHKPANCVLNMLADSPGAAVTTSGPVKAPENRLPHSPVHAHTICILNSFAGMLMFAATWRSAACRVTAQVSGCWRTTAAKLLQLALGDAAAGTANERSETAANSSRKTGLAGQVADAYILIVAHALRYVPRSMTIIWLCPAV
jgi:hypothetical protein